MGDVLRARPFASATGGLVLLALALRWPWPAPTWTHFDEIAFVVLPLGFWGGDLNPHYFNYPTFPFYLSSLLYFVAFLATQAMGGAESLAEFVAYRYLVDGRDLLAITRGFHTLLSTATVAVVAALGRRLYGDRVGLLAALFLTVSPLAVRFAHLAITDTPATFWTTAALWLAVRARQEGGTAAYLLAGLSTGLAAACKYPAAAVAAPVVIALVAGRPAPWRQLLVWAVAALATFSVATPYVWLDLPAFLAHFSDMARTHLLSGSGANVPAWRAHLTRTLPFSAGLAGSLAVVVALAWCLRARRWQDWLVVTAVAAFAAALAVAASAFLRYALPLAPLLALLMARVVALANARRVVFAGLTVGLVAEPLYTSLQTRYLLSGADTRTEAALWIAARAPAGAQIVGGDALCGRLPALTLDELYVRQGHYQRSFGVVSLRHAYDTLARRPVLPTYHADAAAVPAALGVAGELATTRVWLSIHHPVCPPDTTAPAVTMPPEATERRTFSPGAIDAAAFDRQDWYFLPIAGFGYVDKTGPLIEVAVLPPPAEATVSAADVFAVLSWILRAHEASAAGDWSRALAIHDRGLARWPLPERVVGDDVASRLYVHIGNSHRRRGDPHRALGFAERAAVLAPQRVEVANELADACVAVGDLQRAVSIWETLLDDHPRFAPAYHNLARAMDRLGRPDRARELRRRARQQPVATPPEEADAAPEADSFR